MKMRVLNLFTGSGSVALMARSKQHDVKSLDVMRMRGAPEVTFKQDICSFNPDTQLGVWIPDIVWASPPCTEYSTAKTRSPRDIEGANKIVRKTLSIIAWVMRKNPKAIWILENPQTGMLKDQIFMKGKPYVE